MSPSDWGPPTWIFIHTLAQKLREDQFSAIGIPLILQIKTICYHLPCPDCTTHAKDFWSKVQIGNIKTKQDLVNLLFMFHNMVNSRKRQPLFKKENLISTYSRKSLIETFNNFVRNFNTKGNMNLINESFHRNIFLKNFKKWMMENMKYFTL
uniref:thiol oxidase n=1 Tax=viral metagenome TaxID=1070528 RepID=A0A6C0ITB3_9ZZZZ